MNTTILPREIQYNNSLPSLPDCVSQEIVVNAVGGGTFGPGGLIQFDLPSRGFLVPGSVYFRYKVTLASLVNAEIRGTPVFSFFNKLETIFGSTSVEQIPDFNKVCNMMTNMQFSVADKYGMANAYGFFNNTGVPTMEQLDGRTCILNEPISMAAALPCILSASESLIPLGHMPNVRVQLTVDTVANIFTTAVVPTGFTISNIELCYTCVDFNSSVNDEVKNMGDTFYIKSQSYGCMGATVAAASNGTVDLVYNTRYASIKSLFAHFTNGTAARAINGPMDSVDITSGNGELSWNIAGTQYPSRGLSTAQNKSAVLMELKKSVNALHNNIFNFSINNIEFGYGDTGTTTLTAPGKFYFGVNTERMPSNQFLLSGVSSQSSPIGLRITLNTPIANNYNVTCIVLYDALIQVDPINKTAVVKQ